MSAVMVVPLRLYVLVDNEPGWSKERTEAVAEGAARELITAGLGVARSGMRATPCGFVVEGATDAWQDDPKS